MSWSQVLLEERSSSAGVVAASSSGGSHKYCVKESFSYDSPPYELVSKAETKLSVV